MLHLAAGAVTEMACLESQSVMAQEQRYLDFLGAVDSAHVYAGRLWLETGGGRALVFGAVGLETAG